MQLFEVDAPSERADDQFTQSDVVMDGFECTMIELLADDTLPVCAGCLAREFALNP